MADYREGIVSAPHQRSYEDPIRLVEGQPVQITKRDLWNDQFVWIWCISDLGKEGWVPDSFIQVDGDKGIALREYNAIELTVAEGDKLRIYEETHGWYWVRTLEGVWGWVPVENVELME